MLTKILVITSFACLLFACNSQGDKVINIKADDSGFILEANVRSKFDENDEITFEVRLYQNFKNQVEVIYTSHLIGLVIIDENGNNVYELGYDDRIYQGFIGDSETEFTEISPIDPEFKKLSKGNYTVHFISLLTYNEQAIILELEEDFIVNN